MNRKTKTKIIMCIISIIIIILMISTKIFSVGIDTIPDIVEPTTSKTLIQVNDCKHLNTYSEISKEPSHSSIGQKNALCLDCKILLETEEIPIIPHTWSDWTISLLPTSNSNGLESRICSECKEKEDREYICPHETTFERITLAATHHENGEITTFCEACNKIMSTTIIEKINHIFDNYKIKEYATPFKSGLKYSVCSCGDVDYINYYFNKVSSNSVYMPTAKINAQYNVAPFSNEAVDTYDIVLNYARLGNINPIMLGHNTGTMRTIFDLQIGDLIYLYKEDELITYEVFVSEEARVTENKKDIVGMTTGTSLLTKYENETLHLYTCYEPGGDDGRWLVAAKKI